MGVERKRARAVERDWLWRDEERGANIASDQSRQTMETLMKAGMKVFRSGGIQWPNEGISYLVAGEMNRNAEN